MDNKSSAPTRTQTADNENTQQIITEALAKGFDDLSIRDAIDEILGNQWERELAPFREVEIDKLIQLRAI